LTVPNVDKNFQWWHYVAARHGVFPCFEQSVLLYEVILVRHAQSGARIFGQLSASYLPQKIDTYQHRRRANWHALNRNTTIKRIWGSTAQLARCRVVVYV
jgi:hypothetical protein